MERGKLTPELVRQALTETDPLHPVVVVLQASKGKIQELQPEYWKLQIREKETYVKRNYGFLAEAIQGVGDFPADPYNLIKVWSGVTEVFPRNHTLYFTARIIVSCYAVAGNDKPELSVIPYRFLKRQPKIPVAVSRDANSLEHMSKRLTSLRESLSKVHSYMDEFGLLSDTPGLQERARGIENVRAGRVFGVITSDEEHRQQSLVLHSLFNNMSPVLGYLHGLVQEARDNLPNSR